MLGNWRQTTLERLQVNWKLPSGRNEKKTVNFVAFLFKKASVNTSVKGYHTTNFKSFKSNLELMILNSSWHMYLIRRHTHRWKLVSLFPFLCVSHPEKNIPWQHRCSNSPLSLHCNGLSHILSYCGSEIWHRHAQWGSLVFCLVASDVALTCR